MGSPDLVVYNLSYRTRGSIINLDPTAVEKALAVTAYGGFLVGQQAAKRMLNREGSILFTIGFISYSDSGFTYFKISGLFLSAS